MSQSIMPTRMAEGRAMNLVGLRMLHNNDNASITIPKQWQQFKTQYGQLFQQSSCSYGVICGGDANGFEYMCAVEVASFEDAPEALGRIKILPQYYAVFTHSGAIATIGDTWKSILHRTMAELHLQSAHKPDFEVYDSRYDPLTQSGDVEIWISISKPTP